MPRSLTTTTQALSHRSQAGRFYGFQVSMLPARWGHLGSSGRGQSQLPTLLQRRPSGMRHAHLGISVFRGREGEVENGRGNWKGVGCGEVWREGVRNTSSHISAPDRAGSSGSPPARRFVVSVPRSRRARRAQTRPKKSSQLAKRALQPPTPWRKEETCTRARQQPGCCCLPPKTIFKAEITMKMK